MRWQKNGYELDDDRARLDMEQISTWLRGTYWAEKRSHEDVLRSWAGAAVPFGLYEPEGMAGCARVISDFVTTSYLADVFIVREHRGRGLGLWMMECILAHPDLRTTKWLLHTRDAHGLYRKVGFDNPTSRVLERPATDQM